MLGLPIYQTVPIPLYLSMIAYYHLLAPHFRTEKQRAYLLSTLSAAVMSGASIPFVWLYITRGLGGMYEAGQEGWLGILARLGAIFFGVYLFADLSLGYFRYRSQIGLLTGWIHHTVYIALMIYCLSSRQSPIFLTGAFMELPTLDLALSNLFPHFRNDLRFLSSFFLVRIVYNAVLLVDCLRPSSRASMDGSWVPATMLFLAGAMHVSWFQGGLKGYLKRRRQTTTRPIAEVSQEPVADLDEVVSADLLASQPGTPDDSPLITPRTPSLRDTYLPTLAIPSIPSLPALYLPAVPHRFLDTKGDINFGFKDAVKSRWEDRRATLGGMGMNLNLNLGGLGIRRRTAESEQEVNQTKVWVEEVPVGQ